MKLGKSHEVKCLLSYAHYKTIFLDNDIPSLPSTPKGKSPRSRFLIRNRIKLIWLVDTSHLNTADFLSSKLIHYMLHPTMLKKKWEIIPGSAPKVDEVYSWPRVIKRKSEFRGNPFSTDSTTNQSRNGHVWKHNFLGGGNKKTYGGRCTKCKYTVSHSNYFLLIIRTRVTNCCQL